jgi:hypothetical protein
MDAALTSLLAAALAFVGTHFALSHPLRAPLGKASFLRLHSLVARQRVGAGLFARGPLAIFETNNE